MPHSLAHKCDPLKESRERSFKLNYRCTFELVCKWIGSTIIILFAAILVSLYLLSEPAIKAYGLGFIWEQSWNPIDENFGALSFIYGTLLTSLLALVFSAPVCVSLALFITELVPKKLRAIFRFMVEMLAGIPSIIYGMWGLFILAPVIREHVYPTIYKFFPNFFLFAGPSFGVGILCASLILAIMISPIITAVTVEVFRAIPKHQKYAALALGATRWEAIQIAVLKTGKKGILGAIVLGLGRAIGETMAVAMVIGNSPEITYSIFAPAATMSSVIANEYAEAASGLHMASLSYMALILFLITFIVNAIARKIVGSVRVRK